MKKIYQVFLAFFAAMTLGMWSGSAEAYYNGYYHHHHHHYYYRHGHCRWYPAYTHRGIYYPARRVCW